MAKKMLKIKPFIKLDIQLGEIITIGQTKEELYPLSREQFRVI